MGLLWGRKKLHDAVDSGIEHFRQRMRKLKARNDMAVDFILAPAIDGGGNGCPWLRCSSRETKLDGIGVRMICQSNLT